MSAHGKDNGKGTKLDWICWVGLSCDADGQTEQRGSQLVTEVTFSHREQAEFIQVLLFGLEASIFSSPQRPW